MIADIVHTAEAMLLTYEMPEIDRLNNMYLLGRIASTVGEEDALAHFHSHLTKHYVPVSRPCARQAYNANLN